MPKFKVEVEITESYTITVEAPDKSTARDEARMLAEAGEFLDSPTTDGYRATSCEEVTE